VSETSTRPSFPTNNQRSSLRARIRLWTVAVSAATLVAFTAAAILEERRQVLDTEAAHASALLEHLAHMPEFQANTAEAAGRLALLHGSLNPVGGRLELAATGSGEAAPSRTILARRPLGLADAAVELRYRADPDRLRRMTRRSVLIHSVYGVVALAALLAGTEWILRRNLMAPLRALVHEVGLMRDGRGWSPRVPKADEELRELSEALRGLGPGLERQVYEWIEAERRGAAALVCTRARQRLQEARTRVLDRLAQLEAEGIVPPPDGDERIRSLVEEIEKIPAILESEAVRAIAVSGGGSP
jgi:hypothetical protein